MYTQQQQISRKKMINNRLIIAYHQCEVLLNHSHTTDTSPKPSKFEQQNKTFGESYSINADYFEFCLLYSSEVITRFNIFYVCSKQFLSFNILPFQLFLKGCCHKFCVVLKIPFQYYNRCSDLLSYVYIYKQYTYIIYIKRHSILPF